MGKIFCLMGKSSSGKDTLFNYLRDNQELNLKPIISYTTRPKRANEIDGVAYHFIDENQLRKYESKGKVIEQRCYQTIQGPWYYATIDDGQINLAQNNYIIIVTLEAYGELIKYFGEEQIVPLYIEVEDGMRLERAFMREKQQLSPNYEELCRRFLADNKDFSTENLAAQGIHEYYFNIELKQCLEILNKAILSHI